MVALIGAAATYMACNKSADIKSYTYPPPLPTGLTPAHGYPGSVVTIMGSQFGDYKNVVKVLFNGILADSVLSCSDDQILVRVPAGASSGKVSLTVWTNTVDSLGYFTVDGVPTIRTADPLTGLPGDTVRIYGTGYGEDVTKIKVNFNGTQATVANVVDTVITTVVPVGASSGNINVTVNDYALTGPGFSILVAVADPIYQLDFEDNLIDKVSGAAATFIQGDAAAIDYDNGVNGGRAVKLAGYANPTTKVSGAISIPTTIAKQQELTVACWVNWSTARSASYDPIFEFAEARATRLTFMARTSNSSGNMFARFLLQNKTGLTATYEDNVNSGKPLTTGTWVHVALTLSNAAKQMKIYMNGALVGTKAFSNTLADPAMITMNKAYIGAPTYGSANEPSFGGLIDKFQVFNTVLSADQIYTLYFKK